jgi:hypothetical protein
MGIFQLLLTKEGRTKGTIEEYRGYSVIRPYVYEIDDGRKVERRIKNHRKKEKSALPHDFFKCEKDRGSYEKGQGTTT